MRRAADFFAANDGTSVILRRPRRGQLVDLGAFDAARGRGSLRLRLAMIRVSVLCSNLSTNCVMRAILLVDLLRRDFEVRLVGFDTGSGIWAPAREVDIAVVPLPVTNAWLSGWRAWRGEPFRGSDVVVVSKPLPTSLGAGWLAARRGLPVVLDIDDWEVGLIPGLPGCSLVDGAGELLHEAWTAVSPGHFNARSTTRFCDLIARNVGWPKLVSNRWLQRRYGGDLLYHVRAPLPCSVAPVRFANGAATERPWVGFVGTVRPHKGVDVLIDALARIREPGAPGLLLAGADPASSQARETLAAAREKLGSERLRHLPPFPAAELPGVLAACDVISVPSRAGSAARGQIPAKLFDAMAAGRPIVASAVNDMPEILRDCGRVVPPDDAPALAAAIRELLANPSQAAALARAARRLQVDAYSHDAGRIVAVDAVRRALDGSGARRPAIESRSGAESR